MWKYPKTRIAPVAENLHRRKLIDNYRWLEDSDSAEVLAWSEAQNDFATETLSKEAQVELFKRELTDLFKFDSFGLPSRHGQYYFWSECKADQNQAAIYRRKGLGGQPELLLDPNGRRVDDAITITCWSVSSDGHYLLYALSESGSEMSTFYVRDLLTDQELETDTIPYSRHPAVRWLEDESGFFYTRNPKPGTVPKSEELYHQKVYRHQIGRSYETDPQIFGQDRHIEEFYGLDMSDDRTVLIIRAGRDWVQNEIWIHDLASGQTKPVITGLAAQFGLQIVRGRAYLWTDYQAELGRVLVADATALPSDITGWQSFIAERSYLSYGVRFTKDTILALFLQDAYSMVEIVDHDGRKLGNLELPPNVSLNDLSTQRNQAEFFYGYVSFLVPMKSYRYDPESKRFEPYRSVESPINPDDYVAKQEWYHSKDGTRLPMFIVHLKSVKLDGSNPTLVYGYGGFDEPITPFFSRGNLPFLRRGGVYVATNLRGGGEYGAAWHKAGMLQNKQNSFDDFIAAGEYLIDQGYTNPQKFGIIGGSNGGLLVGACAIQRPDLYRAVVCQVPLLDMVRFPRFLMASRWTHEYGDPSIKKDFDYIIRYSPYHNVKPGVEYPATLFMTADHDSRVEPLHARKMAALLQATNQDNVVLIRTEIEAGHGAGTPVNKWIDAHADTLAFLAWQLGLKLT